jgi:hypothetical protein
MAASDTRSPCDAALATQDPKTRANRALRHRGSGKAGQSDRAHTGQARADAGNAPFAVHLRERQQRRFAIGTGFGKESERQRLAQLAVFGKSPDHRLLP